MNQDSGYFKRSSAGQSTTPASIPPPPLPAPQPRPLQRARNVASRFLGYGSRAPSPQGTRDEHRFSHGGQLSRSAPLGATQNATAAHKTGLEIKTISINESGTHAIIAGKEIFKTVKIEDGRCAEDFNLRTVIRSTPFHASGQPRQVYSIDIGDVAWAKGNTGNYVAAATSSGKIIVYDLGHAGLQAAQLHEHFRQVHNVTFSPHNGSLLLSGSQDGTVRLWDVRDVRSQVGTVQSRRKYSGQSDGVRDVKWSPTEGFDFAFGTDTGDVQRWDMRNLKAAKVRVPAHTLSCNTVDWHPDGKHLVTAGNDKVIRVFDVSNTRPGKASWEIKTPHPVMNARWRPSCRSEMPQDDGAGLCTQVIASYDRDHPILHVWDFRRPYLPFREMQPYVSAPTDLLWHSQDLLWTVGREGTFLQTDIQHTPKVIDRLSLQAIDVSPLGELTFVAQSRKQRRVPKPNPEPTPPNLQHKTSSLSTSPESNFNSRSWADDGLDDSFLARLPNKLQARSNSSNRFSSATVRSIAHNQKLTATIKLDDVLQNPKSQRPQQVAIRGHLPGHNNRNFVAYMAEHCASHVAAASSDEEVLALVEKAFEDNSHFAASIGFLQASQTWRIVSFCTIKHLRKRIELKRKRASEKGSPPAKDKMAVSVHSLASRLAAQHISPNQSPRAVQPVSTIAQQLSVPPAESTSDMPTPLARPAAEGEDDQRRAGTLPNLDAGDHLTLPPSLTSAHQGPSLQSARGPVASVRRLTSNSLADMQRNQTYEETAARSEMIKKWSAHSKTVLSLDPVDPNGVKIPLSKLENHGSGESFGFLEDSAGSREASFPASFESDKMASRRMVAERPSKPIPVPMESITSAQGYDGETQPSEQSMFFEGSGTFANSAAQIKQNLEGTRLEASHEDSEQKTNTTDFAFREQVAPEVSKRRSNGMKTMAITQGSVRHGELPELDRGTTQNERLVIEPHTQVSAQAIAAVTKNGFASTVSDHDAESEADLEENVPWTLVEMLQKLLDFYTADQPYPQMASLLILLLGPLLPRTHALPTQEIHQTIASYVDYFVNSIGWDPADVPALIKECFEQPLKAGLQPLQVESILSTYHEQLLSYQLFDGAATLRKLCYPAYPAVYEDYLKDNGVHLMCGHCSKPLPANATILTCAKCNKKQEPCPVCWMQSSPYEAGGPTLFTSCLTCGHSGHAACLNEWFVVVRGKGCPNEGCLCDCVGNGTGSVKEVKRKELGRVNSDEVQVKESKAVLGARKELKK